MKKFCNHKQNAPLNVHLFIIYKFILTKDILVELPEERGGCTEDTLEVSEGILEKASGGE